MNANVKKAALTAIDYPTLWTMLLIGYNVKTVSISACAFFEDKKYFHKVWNGKASSIPYGLANILHVQSFEMIQANHLRVWTYDPCESNDHIERIEIEWTRLPKGSEQ